MSGVKGDARKEAIALYNADQAHPVWLVPALRHQALPPRRDARHSHGGWRSASGKAHRPLRALCASSSNTRRSGSRLYRLSDNRNPLFLSAIRHKRFGRGEARKPWKSVTFGDRTFSDEVRVKRDKSPSETDFGIFSSLRGSVATGKTSRKLGIFAPSKGHLIDSQ